jgi:hypothetical protein
MIREYLKDAVGLLMCMALFFALIYGSAIFGALYHT